MSKTVVLNKEGILKIKKGIDKAWSAVAPTLGGLGKTAIIEVKGLDPIIGDDGITILKNLEFSDPYEQLGLQILRKASIRTSEEGGDGTATTAALTHSLLTSVIKKLNKKGSNWVEIYEELEGDLERTLASLKTTVRSVSHDDIEQIARISSLDVEAAKVIADVIKQVGADGVVTVEKGVKLGYESEVVKGAKFNRGMISPYFMTDTIKEIAELEDCYIVLVDRRVSQNEQIVPLLNSIGTGKSILFIADEVDSVALGTLAQNAQLRVANIACVRNPYQGQMARDFLFDMAALTGATVISEEMGVKLPDATVAMCGKAAKVIVTKDSTTIIGGLGGEKLEERIETIKGEIANTLSQYSKGILEDRLSALTGGIGVIKVGTYTDTEFNAKKYKLDNAVNATQSALQEGIVPGGGIALLRQVHGDNKIINAALLAPFKQMLKNAGMSKLEALFDVGVTSGDTGYDFRKRKQVRMFEAGIVDSFKTTRLALESAVGVAKLFASTEPVIVEE